MTGESGFRTSLCQHGPHRVQREAGGAQRPSGGFLRKAAVERACVGQPADGGRSACSQASLGSLVRKKNGDSNSSGSQSAAGSAGQLTGWLRPGLRTMSMTSARTALAVAGPPAPGPENMTAPTLLPSTSTAFRTPETGGQRRVPAMKCGETKTVSACPCRTDRPSSPQLHPGGFGKRGVLRRDGGNACHADAGRVDVFTEHHVGQNADLAARVDALDVGRSGPARRSRASARHGAPLRSSARIRASA